MTTLGRTTLLLMIPVNLVLVAWVWIGRIVFGVGGWFFLLYLFTVVPVLLVALLTTTVLAHTQPGRPRHLTVPQAWAQLGVWLGMLLYGAVSVDFGDTEDSEISLLTQLFGRTRGMLDLSYWLMEVFAVATVSAWIVLAVMLTAGRRSRPPVPPGPYAPSGRHAPPDQGGAQRPPW